VIGEVSRRSLVRCEGSGPNLASGGISDQSLVGCEVSWPSPVSPAP
jgi:hypothetical protein